MVLKLKIHVKHRHPTDKISLKSQSDHFLTTLAPFCCCTWYYSHSSIVQKLAKFNFESIQDV